MEREVYANAPIVLVACEIRLPDGALRLTDEGIDELREAFDELLPIMQIGQRRQVMVSADGSEQTQRTDRLLHFADRGQRTVVQLAPDSIVVKTSRYEGWDAFRPLLQQVIAASTRIGRPGGYVRVGLRYIDEIRLADGGTEASDWEGYLDDRVLAPGSLAEAQDELEPIGWQAVTRFAATEQHTVVARYGPGDGHATNPTEAPTRPDAPAPGPYFLFDIDSFWEAATSVPPLEADDLLGRLDTLHAPIRELFENAITERLRKDVLRKEPQR